MKLFIGDSKFDTRTLERYVREEKFSKKDFEKYLKELPDETDNAETLPAYEEEAASHPTEPKQQRPSKIGAGEPTFSF